MEIYSQSRPWKPYPGIELERPGPELSPIGTARIDFLFFSSRHGDIILEGPKFLPPRNPT
jgi:hypothetical protein